MTDRFLFVDHLRKSPIKMCEAVREGLESKNRFLPTRYLYDHRGSMLFEQITELPEYYLTRTEQAILAEFGDEIARQIGPGAMLIEFGSGSSAKTRLLIEAILRRQSSLRYAPIDISHDFLCQSADVLLEEYEPLSIHALGAEYFDAIHELPAHEGPRLILFLGSNIGNFTDAQSIEFLRGLRGQMKEADRLLIGIDLAKDASIIEPAYNDAQGVTAAFNRNLLARINRELDADFDTQAFSHRAPYHKETTRIEMLLVSEADQTVTIDGIGASYRFARGETIHTEWSHKFTLDGFRALASRAGLRTVRSWTDPNRWFATVMLSV